MIFKLCCKKNPITFSFAKHMHSAEYGKTCVKQPLKKIDKTKILMTNGSLMKVKSIAECSKWEHSAVLLTCIKQ